MTKISTSAELFLKSSYFLSFFSLWLLVFLVGGCSSNKRNMLAERLANLKGQHILFVINKFNKNPDVIEDWTDYKRYIWRQCETEDMSALGIRDNGAYYLKPKVVCCNIEFDTDRKNIILGSKGLDVCPVKDSLNQPK